ncbi:MAG TPA: outer membrane beta-barrel protein [Chitinophagaceae bacterium]|nr:outer membrane beta-barrel protein [Chitinophagaceae bacterium]
MKSFFYNPILIFGLIAGSVLAASSQSRFAAGFIFRYGSAGISPKTGFYEGYPVSFTDKPTYLVGLITHFPLTGPLSLQPAFYLSILNYDVGNNTNGHFSIAVLYLKIPVDLKYDLSAGPGDLLFGAGPYFSYGLVASAGSSSGLKAQFGNQSGDVVRRGDFGLDIRVEYVFHLGLFLSGNYDVGLENVSPSLSPGTIKNHFAEIGIGGFFGWRGKKGGR